MNRKPYRKTLNFEALETRRMLAGNITLSQSGTVLTLTGDLSDNAVLIRDTQTGGGVIQIIGLDTPGPNSTTSHTTINSAASKTLQGITAIVFNFSGSGANANTGNDAIVLTNLTLSGGVTINSGDGNCFYGIGTFDPTQDHKVDLDIDASLGALTLGAVTLQKGMTINMGGGSNYLRVDQATLNGPAGKNLTVNMGEGTTIASFDQTSVAHLAAFTGQSSSGQLGLTLNDFSANYLSVNSSIGNDSISLTGNTHINNAITMNLNFGDDVVDLDGVTAGSVSVLMGEGANSYTGTDDIISANTTITAGSQADSVTISGGSTGSFNTGLAGGGNGVVGNTISLSNFTITNAATLGAGIGQTSAPNQVTLNNVSAGSLSLTSGKGADVVSLTTVHVTKAFNLDTGAGNDTVTFNGVTAASLSAMLQLGADTVTVGNTTVTGKAAFGGGVGSDTFDDNGGNTFGTLSKVNFETNNVATETPITGSITSGGGDPISSGGVLTIG
jgi:hypothetical protein